MNSGTLVAGAMASVALLFSSVSPAGVLQEDKASDEWEILLTPYLWAAGLDGTSGFGPFPPLELDASFSDIASNLEGAFALHTEFHRGKWAFVIDPMYLSIEIDGSTMDPGITPKATLDAWLVEAWGSYRFADNWAFLAGARWQDQEMKISGLADLPVESPPGPIPDPAPER